MTEQDVCKYKIYANNEDTRITYNAWFTQIVTFRVRLKPHVNHVNNHGKVCMQRFCSNTTFHFSNDSSYFSVFIQVDHLFGTYLFIVLQGSLPECSI